MTARLPVRTHRSPGLAPPQPAPRRPQFLQFRMKIINLKLERFRDRVEFSGNPSKYDVSVTLRNVQPEDEGFYSCYILNPPDRHRGHGRIQLQVLMEGERRGRAARAPGWSWQLLSLLPGAWGLQEAVLWRALWELQLSPSSP